jgi:hypothetical protein
MRTRTILVSAALIGLATTAGVVPALATASASSAAPGSGSQTITVFARHTAITNFDLPPKGDSPGDQVWLSANDYNKLKGGTKVGHSFAYCTGYPRGSTSALLANACQVTFVDSKGQLTTFGFSAASNPDFLAITGGTGACRDARGQVARTFIGNSIRFDIELAP